MTRRIGALAALVVAAAIVALPASAAGQPNPKDMSGVPLPVPDLPAGTLTVRVVRGTFDNNVEGAAVEFTVDGGPRTVTTDAEGRAELTGLRPGSAVRAAVVVDGERVESQSFTMGSVGVRVALVVSGPGGGAAPPATAAVAAERGAVTIGPDSRVVAEMQDDRLNLFYILDVVNASATPVDLGGPLTFELPREARGTTVLQGSTPQATANGARVTVTGPFGPGKTSVQIAYELPYRGGTARVEQVWPARVEQLNLLVVQVGGLTVSSPQLSSVRDVVDQDQPLIVGIGPAIEAGRPLALEIDGLPHHPVWPRNTALALAASIVAIGIWAAIFPGTRRPTRPSRA